MVQAKKEKKEWIIQVGKWSLVSLGQFRESVLGTSPELSCPRGEGAEGANANSHHSLVEAVPG